ncbi:hypothetical protein BHM03_00059721 [Ensete ventricosum]|nr:hypothetical protein BHM03_00059721 [Ensete ventricosum]
MMWVLRCIRGVNTTGLGPRSQGFRTKVGFKLRVKRLNRVESFNAFATRIARRRGWPWLAAAKAPWKEAVGHGQPPVQGRPVAAEAPLQGGCRSPQGAVARRGNSPQGATNRGRGRLWPARRGGCQRHACGRAANRGGGAGRPLVGQLPAATLSTAACVGAAAAA